MQQTKGYEFEDEVASILESLQAKYPGVVSFLRQPVFQSGSRTHRADFELEYKIGGLTHQHLIECQNRTRSSQEIADKIYSIRGTSDRNRYIFVYKDPLFLNAALRKRFEDMGVLYLDFIAFKHFFIEQLDADLALRQMGLFLREILKKRDPTIFGLVSDHLNDHSLKLQLELDHSAISSPVSGLSTKITLTDPKEEEKLRQLRLILPTYSEKELRAVLNSAEKYSPSSNRPVDSAMKS